MHDEVMETVNQKSDISFDVCLACRNVLRKHGLPDDYYFYKYLRFNLQRQVIKAVELGWRVWVSVLILVVIALVIYYATSQ